MPVDRKQLYDKFGQPRRALSNCLVVCECSSLDELQDKVKQKSIYNKSLPLPPGTPGSPVPGTAFGTVNGGYGLTGMRERLLLIGGSLTAAPGYGRWTVTAQVPR